MKCWLNVSGVACLLLHIFSLPATLPKYWRSWFRTVVLISLNYWYLNKITGRFSWNWSWRNAVRFPQRRAAFVLVMLKYENTQYHGHRMCYRVMFLFLQKQSLAEHRHRPAENKRSWKFCFSYDTMLTLVNAR